MTDRRIARTRQLLRDALIALILERGYDTITIQDITDKANLGRATFYLHFKDKEELLTASLEEVFEDLKARIGAPSKEGMLYGTSPSAIIIFEHVAANCDLYRVMLKAQGASELLKIVREFTVKTAEERFRTILPKDSDVPHSMLSHYYAGSMIALATWWLENGMPHSADEMAHIFNRLMTNGMFGYFAEKGMIPNSNS
jgi:AcrR family transcriptional regulator